jgi:hypothetical protein
MLFSVSPNYKINKNLSIRGTFSEDDATRYRYFMPYSLTKSASGTEGGYMDFLNGFGFSDSNRVEDNYEIRVNYQNKFGKFDLNALLEVLLQILIGMETLLKWMCLVNLVS